VDDGDGEVSEMVEPWIEFRPDEKGNFDEIVALKPDMVHVETMSKSSCYIGFYWDDGRYCQFWFHSTKGKLGYSHEHGSHPMPAALGEWE
jgi:hypothetical protein